MPTFVPINEYLDEIDGITLPIGGKSYLIPSPDALTGLEVTRLIDVVVDAANGQDIDSNDARVQQILKAEEQQHGDLIVRILGPALDEMTADGVKWSVVQHVFGTALTWITQGAEQAARYWAAGGGATGKAPNRATRRATRKAPQASAGSRTRPATH